MTPKIKKYKDSLFPDYYWVVMSDNGWDLCKNLNHAIRYWLWHCGLPAKIAFKKYKTKNFYTKQELIDMGFAFTTNGDIVTPDQSNEDLKKYLKYQKQKFIEKACDWLKENLSEGYDPDNYPMVRCYDIDMEDFIKEFRREMEE